MKLNRNGEKKDLARPNLTNRGVGKLDPRWKKAKLCREGVETGINANFDRKITGGVCPGGEGSYCQVAERNREGDIEPRTILFTPTEKGNRPV